MRPGGAPPRAPRGVIPGLARTGPRWGRCPGGSRPVDATGRPRPELFSRFCVKDHSRGKYDPAWADVHPSEHTRRIRTHTPPAEHTPSRTHAAANTHEPAMQKTPPTDPAKQYPTSNPSSGAPSRKQKMILIAQSPAEGFRPNTHGVVRYFLSYGVPPGISGPVKEQMQGMHQTPGDKWGLCGPDGSVLRASVSAGALSCKHVQHCP